MFRFDWRLELHGASELRLVLVIVLVRQTARRSEKKVRNMKSMLSSSSGYRADTDFTVKFNIIILALPRLHNVQVVRQYSVRSMQEIFSQDPAAANITPGLPSGYNS